MNTKIVRGVIVPVVTPFHQDLSIDYKGFENMLSYFNDNIYVDGLFIMGATGEYDALSYEERMHLIDISMRMERKKNFILNTGSEQLETTLNLTKYAKQKGVDIVGVVIPQEYKSFGEVNKYFEKLNELDVAVFIYQTGGSQYKLEIDEFAELLKLGNIVGIKDSCSSKNMYRYLRYIQSFGEKISVIQGVEMLYLSSLVMGADGVVGGGCNVYPELLQKVTECFQKGEILQARRYQSRINELIEMVYMEQSGTQSMKYYLKLSGVELDCYSRKEKDLLTKNKEAIMKKMHAELVSSIA